MAEDQLSMPRRKYNRAKSQPEFSARTQQILAASDPVDPRELTRRLEIWLVEEETRKKYNLPRAAKRVQTSSHASPISVKSRRSSSVSSVSSPNQVQRPLSFSYNPDTLARSLKFHRMQNQQGGLQKQQEEAQKSSTGIVKSTDSPVAVDYPLHAALRAFGQHEAPPARTKTVRKALQVPKPPPEPRDAPTNSKARKQRPKSLPYEPRYAGRSMVLTATPDPVKRESVHVLSQQVLDAYNKPSLPAIDSYSPLEPNFAQSSTSVPRNTSYFSDISRSTDVGPAKHSNRSSLDDSQSPVSPAQPAVLKAGPNKVRPKTWTPRNLVNAIKARNEARDKRMGRNNFQATTVMMEAAQYERGRTAPTKSLVSPHEAAARSKERTVDGLNARGGSRRKTTAFEDFVALGGGQPQSQNGNVKLVGGIPVIIQPGDRRPGAGDWAQDSSDEEENGDSLIRRLSRRVSRRRIAGEGEDREKLQTTREEFKKAIKKEERRGRQLAMRQRAVEVSKKMKSDRKDWEQLPSQRRSPVTSEPSREINSHPLRSHPPEDTQSKQLQESPPQPFVQEPTPPSSVPAQSPPQIDPVLPPSPPEEPLLDFNLDSSSSPPQPAPTQEGEDKLQSSPNNHVHQQQPQQSNTSAVRDALQSPRPILRTQTEPIPPKAPRNDLATLPSQRIAATRNYTPPSRSFTQPLKHARAEPLHHGPAKSRGLADRPKSLFNREPVQSIQDEELPKSYEMPENEKRKSMFAALNKDIDEASKKSRPKSRGFAERGKFLFGSSPADSETDNRPQTSRKEKHKSGFGSADTTQSKSSDRPKTTNSSKRRSFFNGDGDDKVLNSSTRRSQSPGMPRERAPQHKRKVSDGTQESVTSVKNFSRRRSWARPYTETDTGKEVAVEQADVRPTSRGSAKSVHTVKAVGTLVSISDVPRVPALELDHMTPESVDLLRKQEKLLQRMTATSSVINVSVAPGIDVPFGVTVGRIGAATAPTTPGRQTPAMENIEDKGQRKNLEDATHRGRAKQSRFVKTGSILWGASRKKKDGEAVKESTVGEGDGLRLQKPGRGLAVERLGGGSRGISMPDLLGQAEVPETKKSRWKLWKV